MDKEKEKHMLSRLLLLIKPELKGHILENAKVEFLHIHDMQAIQISCKTLDNKSRRHKSYQDVIIKLHPDFFTSKFSQRPFSEISIEFTSFIRNKCDQFIPRTTKHRGESHTTADEWVFPDKC